MNNTETKQHISIQINTLLIKNYLGCTTFEVHIYLTLSDINKIKSTGPDNIHPAILNNISKHLAMFITRIIQKW